MEKSICSEFAIYYRDRGVFSHAFWLQVASGHEVYFVSISFQFKNPRCIRSYQRIASQSEAGSACYARAVKSVKYMLFAMWQPRGLRLDLMAAGGVTPHVNPGPQVLHGRAIYGPQPAAFRPSSSDS